MNLFFERSKWVKLIEVNNPSGIDPSSSFMLTSRRVRLGDDIRTGDTEPFNELFPKLSEVSPLKYEVKLGKFPVNLFELKSRTCRGDCHCRITEMSSESRLLLKSITSQFPTEGGNEPDSALDERFKVVNDVELILGIAPVIEHVLKSDAKKVN